MKKKTKTAVAVGVGLTAAVAAAAAGAYFLTGKRGVKNRKAIKAWAVKAKAEGMREFKKMKVQNAAMYNKMVAQVEKKYRAMNIDPKEVAALVSDLKKHWTVVSKGVKQMAKKVAKKAAPKKAAKKRG